MTPMMRVGAWIIVFSLLGCSSNGAIEAANADADDAEVSAALRGGAPRYTKTSPEVVGKYSSDQGCPGGFDVCYDIEVRRKGAGLEVSLGMDDRYVARAFESRGALVFSVDGLNEDCDDPGCGNLTKISGVIYATRLAGKWVPRIKATVLADFPFPDEEGAPEGEVKTVIRLDKN